MIFHLAFTKSIIHAAGIQSDPMPRRVVYSYPVPPCVFWWGQNMCVRCSGARVRVRVFDWPRRIHPSWSREKKKMLIILCCGPHILTRCIRYDMNMIITTILLNISFLYIEFCFTIVNVFKMFGVLYVFGEFGVLCSREEKEERRWIHWPHAAPWLTERLQSCAWKN